MNLRDEGAARLRKQAADLQYKNRCLVPMYHRKRMTLDFCVIVYGYTAEEMCRVPCPVPFADLYPDHLSSIFQMRPLP